MGLDQLLPLFVRQPRPPRGIHLRPRRGQFRPTQRATNSSALYTRHPLRQRIRHRAGIGTALDTADEARGGEVANGSAIRTVRFAVGIEIPDRRTADRLLTPRRRPIRPLPAGGDRRQVIFPPTLIAR